MAQFGPVDIDAARKEPTVQVTDASGFRYSSTSPVWKDACAPLPSCLAVQWPGYATTCIEATVAGQPAIIQPWMGDCQRAFGESNFPGGIGGEVGVYVRRSVSDLPDLALLPAGIQLLLKGIALLGGGQLWWPDPNVQPDIEFTIVNPVNHSVFLHSPKDNTYWANKWMDPASYEKYKAAQPTPSSPLDFKMIFTVDGHTRAWIPSTPTHFDLGKVGISPADL